MAKKSDEKNGSKKASAGASKAKKQEIESDADRRKSIFFNNFKAEAPFIRDEIVRDLPAYNLLLSLQAESFDDIALRVIAKQRGELFDPRNPPVPDCPYCHKRDQVGTKGTSRYRCRRCERDFSATHNSIVSNKRSSDIKFLRTVIAILEGRSQTEVCKLAGVAPTTYYRIRNRLLYAIQLMLEDVRLYGVVEADCCFVNASYKGIDLESGDFEEDSMFYDETAFIPREARQRGGSYPHLERNANSIAILSLCDEYGNVANIFCGTGVVSRKTLKMYVPENKILHTVPMKNPFAFSKKRKKSSTKTKTEHERGVGDSSLLVIDKEAALVSYAQLIGIECESHVYRDKGVQRKLSPNWHHIQHINSMHSRLKRFLSQHTVSTKYLPGYLLLFDFKEMTGMAPEAIQSLLEIMATPGLGKPPAFYRQLFIVPNYLLQWFNGDHPLKKLPYNDLLSFYLYDHVRNKANYPDNIPPTMAFIERATGYSSRKIRTVYRNLLNAGYKELILTYFGEAVEGKTAPAKPTKTVPPVIPLLHKEWGEYVCGRKQPMPTFAKFLREQSEQHGKSLNQSYVRYWFKRVEEMGICDPLPPKEEWPPVMPDIPQIIFHLYNEWCVANRAGNGSKPSFVQFHKEKCEQYGLDYAYTTLKKYFRQIEQMKLGQDSATFEPTIEASIPTERDYKICTEFDLLMREQEKLGDKGLQASEARKVIAEKFGLSPGRVKCIISDMHQHLMYQRGVETNGHSMYPLREMEERAERAASGNGSVSLQQYNPVVAARWHPTKNGGLTPDAVSYGSAKRVWWLCPECGHEWEAEVRRQIHKLKCPMCVRRSKDDFMGFLDEDEALAVQWHTEKNGELLPGKVARGSIKKVWWRCELGHEWQMSILERSHGGGCPVCQGRKVLAGFNDLSSQFPALAAQWHPTKNGEMTPEQIVIGSTKKVWWRCENGHEWEAIVRNRTKKKSGCPYCAGVRKWIAPL